METLPRRSSQPKRDLDRSQEFGILHDYQEAKLLASMLVSTWQDLTSPSVTDLDNPWGNQMLYHRDQTMVIDPLTMRM